MIALFATACSPPPGDDEASETAASQVTAPVTAHTEPAPVVDSNPLRNAYFGETHLHTAYSLDAYIGGARLTPADAYRFAKGEAVEALGQGNRISKPLDFAAVTDHAEYLGEMQSTMVEGTPGHDQELLQQLRALTDENERRQWFLKYVIMNTRGDKPQHPPFYAGPETTKSAWKVTLDAAEQHNDPGRFTALVAFEWSSAPKGANLHRNVIFRGAQVPDLPVSSFEVPREEALWEWLGGLEKQGINVLAIPHNSNASKGLMFADTNSRGEPLDLGYAEQRAHFEPLIEMMQVKGNSEVHRKFWPADEFADFENADSLAKFSERVIEKRNFVRAGVTSGLAWEQKLGANPYKLGFVGGTDSHNGMPGDVEEYDWPGGHGLEDGSPARRQGAEVGGWLEAKDLNPGALTGVWAESNTRDSIWDAMKRRETFATSGTRLRVRFFGGWDFPQDLTGQPDMLQRAYAGGVPMGGDLQPSKQASTPRFVVWAVKDPDGANLDRIQLIKTWVDADGEPHETIHDVVWSEPETRVRGVDGKLPPVGNSVDLGNASYRNTIGAAELSAVWSDPEFDPARHALYYIRVLEIPTPRWSTHDAVKAGLELLDNVPATVQERAWSSPIWYPPAP
ncbi:MAG: DUF3604 domain-containing protein [Gammaproteobacteria bacterium]|nr:DUF3604 domain-containing protein [Gammaproteobacteria bacterium]